MPIHLLFYWCKIDSTDKITEVLEWKVQSLASDAHNNGAHIEQKPYVYKGVNMH